MLPNIAVYLSKRLQIVISMLDGKSKFCSFYFNSLHDFLDVHHNSIFGEELRSYCIQRVVVHPKPKFLPVDDRVIVIEVSQDTQKVLKVYKLCPVVRPEWILQEQLMQHCLTKFLTFTYQQLDTIRNFLLNALVAHTSHRVEELDLLISHRVII